MRNTADMTGGRPITVSSQSISDVNPLIAFYDLPGRKKKVLFYSLSTTRDVINIMKFIFI
jgi:hypothetical protein